MVIERAKISEQKKEWFVQNYPNMRDVDLANELGVCTMTISRMAHRRGLKKSDEFVHLTHIRAIEAARLHNIGRHDPRCISHLKQYQFRKGENTLKRFGQDIENKRISKSTESRNALLKKERARMIFGLPRKTRYNLGQQNPKRARVKWYLTSRGYHVDDDARVAYYDESTTRGRLTEKRNSKYYQFIYGTK